MKLFERARHSRWRWGLVAALLATFVGAASLWAAGEPLDVEITDTHVTALPGEILTYTITATNNTGGDLSNISLSMFLPNNVTYIGSSDGGGFLGNTVLFPLVETFTGTPPGNTLYRYVTVRVNSPLANNTLLSASATGAAGLDYSDSATDTTLVSAPNVAFDPASLDFGELQVGATSPAKTAQLKNTGSAPLTFTSIVASGDYAVTSDCISPIAPDSFCTLSVTFTPTAAGSRPGAITVIDNAIGSPHTLPLAGVGAVPVAANDSYSLNEDALLSVPVATGVLANDTTPPGGTITAVIVTGPTNGSLTLNANGSFSYTPNANYSGPDSFTYKAVDNRSNESAVATVSLTVSSVNDAPSDIALSSSTLPEDSAVGTPVGTLSATDVDTGDTFTYSLVSGSGSTDNASFAIVGNELRTAAALNFETKTSYSVRVRATDAGGLFVEKIFAITVTNVNEAPTNISFSPASVAENSPLGTNVGTLSATDPDAGDTFTYSLVAGTGDTDNASFTISGSTLQTAIALDFETKTSYSVLVRATDAGGKFFEKALTIAVTNVNEPPTDITLSNATIEEGLPNGTVVGSLSNNDPDAGNTFTYSLVAPNNGAGGRFTIVGNQVRVLDTTLIDFETTTQHTITVRVSDGTNSFTKDFVITVLDDNDAPTDLALAPTSVAENQAAGTVVGDFTATDPNVGDTFTYSLVGGTGSTDNASFTVVGSQLQTAVAFDYEAKSSYSVRVRVADGAGAFFEKVFTITVTNVVEVPTVQADNYTTREDQALTVDAATGVMANDSNPDGAGVTAQVDTPPTNGTLTLNADGSFTYTPNADYNGGDSFMYKLVYGASQETAPARVNITVFVVNDAPSFTKGADETVAEDSGAQTVSGWASAISAGPANEASQTLSFTASADNTALFAVQPAVAADGTLTYTPAPNAFGSATVTVTLADNGGTIYSGQDSSAPQTFAISITPVNDNPTAQDDALAVGRDSTNNLLNVLANDSIAPDADETLAITAVSQPGNGTAQIAADGRSLLYTPSVGFSGQDSLTYTIDDGNGGSASAMVAITVQTFRSFLPLLDGVPKRADLVGSFSLDPSSLQAGTPVTITATVTNQGEAAAGGFWVDFYINPNTPPTTANTPWNETCGALDPCFGIAWYVESLAPGATVTLTSTADSYFAKNTVWLGYFARGTSDLYLFVDSWNRDDSSGSRVPTGAVLESDESNNRAERHGQAVTGAMPAAAPQFDPSALPDRPNVPAQRDLPAQPAAVTPARP